MSLYRFIGPLDSAQAYGMLCASPAPLTGSNSVAIIFIVCFCLFNPVAYLASLVVFLNHWPFPMGLSVVHLPLSCLELWGAAAFASCCIDIYWMPLHRRCIELAFTVLLYHVPLNGDINSTSVPLFLTVQNWGCSFCAPYVVSIFSVRLDSMWCYWMYYSSILCVTHDGVSRYSSSYQGCLGWYPCHSTWCLPSFFRISALSEMAYFVYAWYVDAELAIAMTFLVVLAMVDESGVLAICSPFASQLTAPAVAPLNLVSLPLAHDCLGSVHGICHGVQTTRYSPWHVLGALLTAPVVTLESRHYSPFAFL